MRTKNFIEGKQANYFLVTESFCHPSEDSNNIRRNFLKRSHHFRNRSHYNQSKFNSTSKDSKLINENNNQLLQKSSEEIPYAKTIPRNPVKLMKIYS